MAVNSIDEIIKKELLRVAFKIQQEAKKNIVENKTVFKGQLLNSIQVEIEGNTVIVGSKLEYAPHIEFGTKPHFPPLEPIEEWVRLKLQKKEFESIAEAIAWHIYHYGTPPKPFLRPAIDKVLAELK